MRLCTDLAGGGVEAWGAAHFVRSRISVVLAMSWEQELYMHTRVYKFTLTPLRRFNINQSLRKFIVLVCDMLEAPAET